MKINNILSEVKVPNANENIVVTLEDNHMTSSIQESLLNQEQSHAPKMAGIDESSCQHQLSFNFLHEKTGN